MRTHSIYYSLFARFSCLAFLLSTFYFLLSTNVEAAVLYVDSPYQVIRQGETFTMDWFVDTENEQLNAVDLKFHFSTNSLEVVDASIGNSLLSFWIQNPHFNNSTGQLTLTAGLPNGFNGSTVPLFRTTFKAKAAGNAEISLDPSSQMLHNSEDATPAVINMQPLLFQVTASSVLPGTVVTSLTHPNQNQWYKKHVVVFSYPVKSTEKYSYNFGKHGQTLPEDQSKTKLGYVEYANVGDGVYYFTLNTGLDANSWRGTSVLRVQIDSTPPEAFTPTIATDTSLFNGKPFLNFSTVDKTSGVSYYTVKIGLFGLRLRATMPYEIHRPLIGSSIKVTAVDAAGNARVEKVPYKGYIPTNIFLILLGLLVSIISWLLFRNKKLV